MSERCVVRFPVFYDECGPSGRARASTFLRHFQEAGFRHSAEGGFSYAWYLEQGVAWFAHETVLRVHRLPAYPEIVTVTTWVESFGRSRARRRYDARDERGAALARGRTDWVFMDARTGRPAPIPPRAREVFPLVAEGEDDPAPRFADPPGEPHRTSRVVQVRDLDPMGHVNNAAYLDYVDQALADALAASGGPPFDRLAPAAHHLEHRRPAAAGDRLDVLAWVAVEDVRVRQQTRIVAGAREALRAASEWTAF